MYPLFESVCIANGAIKNGSYHEARFKKSYFSYFKKNPDFLLFNGIELSSLDATLTYKLRIKYDAKGTNWAITEYTNKLSNTLQLVYDNEITYSLKYNDRRHLDRLFELKNDADDVLIITNATISDASYSNILFTNGLQIVTPSTPLLHGTCRARLLLEHKITEAIITPNDLQQFHSFQLINALNDFDATRWVSIENIFLPK